MAQLQAMDNYQMIQRDPTKEVTKLMHQLATRGLNEGYLSELEFGHLNKKDPCVPTIYTLPKVLKNRKKPQGRPIFSGVGSLLEPLCKYID